MENNNSANNNAQNEQPTANANLGNFGSSSAQVCIDTGSGLSNGADSVFGQDFPEDDTLSEYSPADINTLPFTQMQSAMVTPSYGQEPGSIVPSGVNSGFTSFGDITKLFTRRQARPTFVARGTNVLVPFGASNFIYALGKKDITSAKTDLSATTQVMNGLIPNMNTPGSYREVANWRRIFELKNTVIGYYNRSIPFTDLEASHRFALEMCYMRDICLCMMPIFAKKYALDLVGHWQRSGFQYDVSKLTNLNDLTLERLNKQIFAAIADLPSMDDVMLSRLGALTRLRVTSKRTGFTPTIMLQDVTIGGPGVYKLANADVGSGYIATTNLTDLSANSAFNGTTFMEWVELWMRADLASTDVVTQTLSQYLALAQSIRTNYTVLLACAQQLDLKGAVKYSSVGSFLPVSGVGEYKLDYKLSSPTFSYAYKERFEYAPRYIAGEDATGSNMSGFFVLSELPSFQSSSYDKLTMRRPVGLYKGPSCWGTKEIAEIGMWRNAGAMYDGDYRYTFRYQLANRLGATLTDGNMASPESILMDAYYGDLYSTQLSHLQVVSNSTSVNSITYYSSTAEYIQYYGLQEAAVPAFGTLDSYIADGGSTTSPMTVAGGGQTLALESYDLSSADSPASLLIPAIVAVLEQLDMTLYIGNPKNQAGNISTPIIVFTNYRGCEFDDFDLAPMDNAFASSYQHLTIGLKPKTARE